MTAETKREGRALMAFLVGAPHFNRFNDLARSETAGNPVALLCFSPRVSHFRRQSPSFIPGAAL